MSRKISTRSNCVNIRVYSHIIRREFKSKIITIDVKALTFK